MIHFVIITGLSGAGRSQAMKVFEDMGYFCVDNLPPALIPKFAELCTQSEGHIQKVALVCDIRGGEFFNEILQALGTVEEMGLQYQIVYLEATDEVLIRRFKETRRRHPLAHLGNLTEGIQAERARLAQLRGHAKEIIDTSAFNVHQLRDEIYRRFSQDGERPGLLVRIVSFGFKHGIPLDSDLLFDVRFLPNPHWVDELRPQVGSDPPVRQYVLSWPISQKFLQKTEDLLELVLPQYEKEGRAELVIGIGCTGGRHRSVTMAESLGSSLQGRGYEVAIEHRDVEKKSVVLPTGEVTKEG